MISIGQFNHLVITRFTDHGAYVDGGHLGEILVPKKFVERSMRPGDELELFVYLDQSERLVATTEQPLATVGDFAFLEVNWVNEHGAFLNWGVLKDLFVPFRQQKRTMEVGEAYIVFVDIDEETGRIIGTAKINRHLRPAREHYYHRGQEVDLLVWQRTELGLKVIVDNRHAGLIYNDDLFPPEPKTGDRIRGYVVNVRPDGRLDISLQRLGKSRFRDFAEVLWEAIATAPEGILPFTDKSSSEAIAAQFGVSKKTFKRAVGTLYREQKINILPEGLQKR